MPTQPPIPSGGREMSMVTAYLVKA